MDTPRSSSAIEALIRYVTEHGVPGSVERMDCVRERLEAVTMEMDARLEGQPIEPHLADLYALLCKIGDLTDGLCEMFEREGPNVQTFPQAIALIQRAIDTFTSTRPPLVRFAEIAAFHPHLETLIDDVDGTVLYKVSACDDVDRCWYSIACAHDPGNAIVIAAERLRGQTPGCVAHLRLEDNDDDPIVDDPGVQA